MAYGLRFYNISNIKITVMALFLGDNIQGVSGSPVSWEHFFHSLMLYHENLRRDIPNPDATQYRHPPLRGITHREQEGLTSFLQLLTTIVTWVLTIMCLVTLTHLFELVLDLCTIKLL